MSHRSIHYRLICFLVLFFCSAIAQAGDDVPDVYRGALQTSSQKDSGSGKQLPSRDASHRGGSEGTQFPRMDGTPRLEDRMDYGLGSDSTQFDQEGSGIQFTGEAPQAGDGTQARDEFQGSKKEDDLKGSIDAFKEDEVQTSPFGDKGKGIQEDPFRLPSSDDFKGPLPGMGDELGSGFPGHKEPGKDNPKEQSGFGSSEEDKGIGDKWGKSAAETYSGSGKKEDEGSAQGSGSEDSKAADDTGKEKEKKETKGQEGPIGPGPGPDEVGSGSGSD